MEFQRQQLYDWNQRVAAVMEHNSRMTQLMFASMATGQILTMEPPPPPPRPQPVVPMFEQFLADHYNVTRLVHHQPIQPQLLVYSIQSYIALPSLFKHAGNRWWCC